MKEKTWVSGSLSPYQLHDITHRPDWENLIVWTCVDGRTWVFHCTFTVGNYGCSGNCGSGFDPADF